MSLKIFEFMRRYLEHVLPRGFTKVRHYGFLALICTLYELIVKLLPKKKPTHRKPWTRSEAGAKRRQRSGKCKSCGGLIRWREFIPCPRGAG